MVYFNVCMAYESRFRTYGVDELRGEEFIPAQSSYGLMFGRSRERVLQEVEWRDNEEWGIECYPEGMMAEIESLLEGNDFVVAVGPAGSGKTHRLYQYFEDGGASMLHQITTRIDRSSEGAVTEEVERFESAFEKREGEGLVIIDELAIDPISLKIMEIVRERGLKVLAIVGGALTNQAKVEMMEGQYGELNPMFVENSYKPFNDLQLAQALRFTAARRAGHLDDFYSVNNLVLLERTVEAIVEAVRDFNVDPGFCVELAVYSSFDFPLGAIAYFDRFLEEVVMRAQRICQLGITAMGQFPIGQMVSIKHLRRELIGRR